MVNIETDNKKLLEVMDEVGYQLISRYHPEIIATIQTSFDDGQNARDIQYQLTEKYGRETLGMLARHAAHHMEETQ